MIDSISIIQPDSIKFDKISDAIKANEISARAIRVINPSAFKR